MTRPKTLPVAVLALLLAACGPTFDWREFMPEGSGVVASFPCRPDRHQRMVPLAGANRSMQMTVCATKGVTFAVAFVDVADPTAVTGALAELRAVAVANVRAAAPQLQALNVRGMTANPAAGRLAAAGHLPDGAPIRVHAAFFVHDLRLYQATVIGADPPADVVQTFFDALRLPA